MKRKQTKQTFFSVLEFVWKKKKEKEYFFLYVYNRMGENDGDNLAIILSVIEGNAEMWKCA